MGSLPDPGWSPTLAETPIDRRRARSLDPIFGRAERSGPSERVSPAGCRPRRWMRRLQFDVWRPDQLGEPPRGPTPEQDAIGRGSALTALRIAVVRCCQPRRRCLFALCVIKAAHHTLQGRRDRPALPPNIDRACAKWKHAAPFRQFLLERPDRTTAGPWPSMVSERTCVSRSERSWRTILGPLGRGAINAAAKFGMAETRTREKYDLVSCALTRALGSRGLAPAASRA